MSAGGARWSDLRLRIVSGVVLAAVALAAILIRGPFFDLFVAALAVAVTWEQARMFAGGTTVSTPVLAAVCLGLGLTYPLLVLPLAAASALVFAYRVQTDRVLAGLSNLVALTGAFGFIFFGYVSEPMMLFWLIGVVVLTDVGGYFGGRLIGGPKLWPAVSPKKTWSGTLTGWVLAALFTIFFPPGMNHAAMIPAAVVLSAASQAGDLFESHVKRRRGIKDSSNLIPGHGGVWDRFDGMLTAALAAWVVSVL
jgi:phosphatidate cytidylyltransferase